VKMAKIQIQHSSVVPRESQASDSFLAWGSSLSLRVQWVSNKCQAGQWGNAPYLFVKLKVLDESGHAHFEDWAGGFYLTAGDLRLSSAVFALDNPLPDGHYTIRVFRSADGKTWVADGASRFIVGEPKPLPAASEQTTKSLGIPFQLEDEPLRWAVGTR
jgi:hypothetical protein